jgi:tetratricopeptide (TPR) repeat protein
VAALAGAMLGVLVHNLIDFAIFEPGVWTTFWVVMACLIAGDSQQQTDSAPAKRIKPLPKISAVFIALALLAVYWLYVWRPVYVATTNIGRAQHAASIGQFDRAHDLLDAAFAADPLSAAPLNMNGRLYVQQYNQMGQRSTDLLDRAAQCFETAVRVNPANYKNYEKLANVYSNLGRHEKAFEWYEKAARLYPGCGRLWLERARAAEQLGCSQAALKAYRQAVAIEDSYRRQFRRMYPEEEHVVSRLGEENYRFARERIAELAE